MHTGWLLCVCLCVELPSSLRMDQTYLAWWDVQSNQLALTWPVDLCIWQGLDTLVT